VEESILDRACSDVVTSQGDVAAFSRPSAPAAGSFTAACPLLVLLDRPTDPGNVGTVIRTAFGLGADALVVVEGCDAFSPKVSRASMGTNLQLPILETTWDGGAVESLLFSLLQSSSSASASASDAGPDSRVLQLLLAVPDPSADPYFSVDLSLPTVIAVGSEAHGLSDACFGLANAFSSQKARPGAGADNGLTLVARKVFIPTARPLESFNAAMAATLLLGEAARQRFSSSVAGSRSEGAQGTVKGKSKGNKGKSIKDAQE
jgi:TrmH family RNA methyltransferase